MSAAKALHERAQAIVNALDGPQDAEAVEALTEELAEISNALQKDGETIGDQQAAEDRALLTRMNLHPSLARLMVHPKKQATGRPWNLEADTERNSKFKPSSPQNM